MAKAGVVNKATKSHMTWLRFRTLAIYATKTYKPIQNPSANKPAAIARIADSEELLLLGNVVAESL